MTNKNAVILAGIFHYCVRFAIFISPLKYCSNAIGGVPALFVLIGVCLLLVDFEIFPQHFNHPNYVRTFRAIEFIWSLLAIEFFMILIWTRIEQGLVMLIKHMLSRGDLYREMGGDNFLTFIIGSLSISFLLWVITVSNSSKNVIKYIVVLPESVRMYFQRIKSNRSGLIQSPPCMPTTSTTTTTTVHQCQPKLPRNPCCPVHGDFEITQTLKKSCLKKN